MYKRNEWGKTKYGTATSLKQRYLEGVVQDIAYRKSGAPLYLMKFSALESKDKFWFTQEKLLTNVLYVVSESHLPKNAIVVHNLEVDLNVAVKSPKLDLVGKSNAPETMAALVAENNQLRQKLTEASAVISNYAATLEKINFQVEKMQFQCQPGSGTFSFPNVLAIPIIKFEKVRHS